MPEEMNTIHWVFLSPHLDDAVLSCGGMIWEQVQQGCQVEIWTVFAGDPPMDRLTPFAQSLHDRWQTGVEAVAERRREDEEACRVLGVIHRHLDYPDCIYRYTIDGEAVIAAEEDLFQQAYQGEPHLVSQLASHLRRALPGGAVLAAPQGIGWHIDHQVVARATTSLEQKVWSYADYPYAAALTPARLHWQSHPGRSYLLPVSENGLHYWQESVAAYISQISTFWGGLDQMRAAIAAYWSHGGGSMLRSFL